MALKWRRRQFQIVKDQVASYVQSHHERPRSTYSVFGCVYKGYMWRIDASSRREREALRYLISQVFIPSNQVGSDGDGTLRFRVLREESLSLPTW